MKRYFLTGLKIEGFRGINNEGNPLELRFKDTSVNSVFAINGTGKSSVFEALTYAIRGSIPKLSALPSQDKPDNYINNRFHSKNTATISLTFLDDSSGTETEITVVRDHEGQRQVSSSTGLSDPESFLRSLDREFSLIDYKTFTQFMDESPLNRGRSFSSLIGLAKYAEVRQTLQAVSDTRAFATEFQTKELSNAIDRLEETVRSETSAVSIHYTSLVGDTINKIDSQKISEKVVDALAKTELLRSVVANSTLLTLDFVRVRDALIEAEGGPLRDELHKVTHWITAVDDTYAPRPEEVDEELQHLRDLIDQRDQLAEGSLGPLHRRVFSDAHELLASTEWQHDQVCPLCTSELDFSLSASVAEELSKLKDVVSKDAAIKNFYEASKISARVRDLESGTLLSPSGAQVDVLIRSACLNGRLSIVDVSGLALHLKTLEANLSTLSAAKSERRDELQSMLPPSMAQLMTKVEDARQIQKSLKSILAAEQELKSMKAKSALYSRWGDFLKSFSETFAVAESEMASDILTSVEAEHKRLFNAIMRADNIIPQLTRVGIKQDLHINLDNFYGLNGLSAQALLSESYSNAIAISIFLAAAVQDKGPARFIVLDDITSSFDSGHQWQLMEQIRSTLQYVGQQAGIQFVILSHDGLLEKYFDTLGSNKHWHHQKLQGLPAIGAVTSTNQSTDRIRDSIEALLNTGVTDNVGPLIRQYLEFKLIRIISKLRIPVPIDFAIKDNQKMVSNAVEAIQAAIVLHRSGGTLILDNNQVDAFEMRIVPSIIGNFMSHYATGSTSSFTINVLSAVVANIDDLDDCFKFDEVKDGNLRRIWYKSLSKKS